MSKARDQQRRDAGLPSTVDGVVRDMGHGGDAVAETELGVVFVPGALPGERVRIEGLFRQRRTLFGRLAQVLEPSPDRIVPSCDRVERCGGCPWMHATKGFQERWKRSLLEATLARACGEEPAPPLSFRPADQALGYRRRARLAWEVRGKKQTLGYRRRRSRRLMDAPECGVLRPSLLQALARVRETLLPQLQGRGEVSIALGHGGHAAIALTTDGDASPRSYEAAAELAEETNIAGVALYAAGLGTPAIWGDPRDVSAGVDGLPVVGTIAGFSQAQDAMNLSLVVEVERLAQVRDQRVLELYAGCGNLTIALAPEASQLTVVELDPAASAACRDNLALRGLDRVRVVAADASQALAKGRYDVVVLDPPRSGAKDALAGIVACRPDRIVYVSCSPPTLGRDLAQLRELGYVLETATGFDMFPQTAHMEAVVRLRRR